MVIIGEAAGLLPLRRGRLDLGEVVSSSQHRPARLLQAVEADARPVGRRLELRRHRQVQLVQLRHDCLLQLREAGEILRSLQHLGDLAPGFLPRPVHVHLPWRWVHPRGPREGPGRLVGGRGGNGSSLDALPRSPSSLGALHHYSLMSGLPLLRLSR